MDKIKFKKNDSIIEAWYDGKVVEEYDTDDENQTESQDEWKDRLKKHYSPERQAKIAKAREAERIREANKTDAEREAERLEEERYDRLKTFYFRIEYEDKTGDNDINHCFNISAETKEEAEKIFKKIMATAKLEEE